MKTSSYFDMTGNVPSAPEVFKLTGMRTPQFTPDILAFVVDDEVICFGRNILTSGSYCPLWWTVYA